MNAVLQWSNRVALDGDWVTWGELRERGLVAELEDHPGPVAIVTDRVADAWEGLAAMVSTRADGLVVGGDRLDAQLESTLAQAGYRVWRNGAWRGEPRDAKGQPGRISVVTSGTSGAPKLVPHTLDSLGTMRSTKPAPRCWLCPYAPGTYAWYQCALLGLLVGNQDVAPVHPAALDDWVETALEFGVTAISATPTFWRRTFLMTEPQKLKVLPLQQLSLGGEPVPQTVIDRLASLYPDARITHIYASSEAGASIVVSDGRAGFPSDWLDAPRPSGVEIQVREGRLFLRSPWANAAAGEEWIDTGDRVVVSDDRVEVVGREEQTIINVGGAKVSTTEVADVLSAHPAVAWCKVTGRRSHLVGQLPVAEVALVQGAFAGERELIDWCSERLPEVAVPRIVKFTTEIPSTLALKSAAG